MLNQQLTASQGAWDSYIQGTNTAGMDAGQMWPMNLDLTSEQQIQQQNGVNGNAFMGAAASTPGGSTNMM